MDSNENVKMTLEKLDKQAGVLKALSHPIRLCIVRGLLRTGGCCVHTIQECLELPQSTISQHLATLRAAGILEATRRGVNVEYRVVNPLAIDVARAVDRAIDDMK